MNLNIINKKITSLLFAALMITSVFAAFMMPVAAAGRVDLSIQPPARSVGVGETFTLEIRAAAGVQPVSGISAFLNFNPRYIEVVSITPGGALPTVLQNRFNNAVGTIDYSAGVRLGDPSPTGTFAVANITFRAIRATTATTIEFSRISPRQTAASHGGNDITGTTVSANVTVTAVPGVVPTPVGPGTAFNTFPATTETRSVLLGQDVRITNLAPGLPVRFDGDRGVADGHHFTATANAAGVADIDTTALMRTGRYNVSAQDNLGRPVRFYLSVDSPTLTLRLELAGTDTAITRVTRGGSIETEIFTNIHPNDIGDIRLTDPKGLVWFRTPVGNESLRLPFGTIDRRRINTSGWDAGTWTIEIRTVEAQAQGLDKRSAVIRFEVVEEDISIRVTDDTISVNETTIFTVTAPANTWVTITVNTDNVVLIPNAGDVRERPSFVDDGRTFFRSNRDFSVRIRPGGTFVFALRFTDDGAYTVTARTDREVDIDITVADEEITIDSIPAFTVGRRVTLTGTAVGLDFIYVRIECPEERPIPGWASRRVSVDADDTWDIEWNTVGLEVDTYRIRVFRNMERLENRRPDDVTAVRLIDGELDVVVRSTVSQSDSDNLEINGTAIGTNRVRMIVIENRDSYVVRNRDVTVTRYPEWTFNKDMDEELDRGMYTVLVIHPGGDRVFIPRIMELVRDEGRHDPYPITRLIERVREEIGRNDVLVVREFLVESDQVTISPIRDIAVGRTLTINAETNRDDGTIAIVTLIGPGRVVRVGTTTVKDGDISVRFDTTGFAVGDWRVEIELPGTDMEDATFRVIPPTPALTDIRVPSASVVVGRTYTFGATPIPAGAVLGTVTWTVANTTVGTITPAGVFTARAAGTTTINATYGGITGTATATVTAPPAEVVLTGISVPAAPAPIVVGETHTFRATPIPAGARLGTVTWTVANPAIGTITPAGVFTARAAGTTTITATYGGVTGTTTVTVTDPPVPGFGIVAAIVGLLGVALLMLKKNKK